MKNKPQLDITTYERGCRAIAHGALTNSKRAESFVKGVYPTHLTKGKGCHVWDTHGNKYIDFICGLGSNLLGYGNEDITSAIAKRASLGATLSLGTDLEIETAEKVKEIFPFIERLRFLKTGTDACTAAIRIARAFTRRKKVFSEGYHGWSDEFVSLTPPANGIVAHDSMWPLKSLFNIDRDTAAVIVEAVNLDISPRRRAFLEDLRRTCKEFGALLIFDEVITGFRFPLFGVSNDFNVEPDLICLGKSMGGGMPLSVVAGKIGVMESDYFISSTFAGETLSLAASLKTMQLLQTKYSIEDLWEKGAQFMFRFNEIWREGLILEGYPTRSVFKGSDMVKALFMQEACRAGILVGPSFFFIFPHIELIDEVLSTFSDILMRVRSGAVSLSGEMPRKPQAQKVRDA